jgi:hypothetical protein
MSKIRISPQLAFRRGFRAGLNQALDRMRCKAEQWESQIGELQHDYEVLLAELRCARYEEAIRQALVERATHNTWLN